MKSYQIYTDSDEKLLELHSWCQDFLKAPEWQQFNRVAAFAWLNLVDETDIILFRMRYATNFITNSARDSSKCDGVYVLPVE